MRCGYSLAMEHYQAAFNGLAGSPDPIAFEIAHETGGSLAKLLALVLIKSAVVKDKDQLLQQYRDRLKGMVISDPELPASINVAMMIASLEDGMIFQCPEILVVMDQFTRRIIGFGVQAIAVDGPGLCRIFNQAISGHGLPTRVRKPK